MKASFRLVCLASAGLMLCGCSGASGGAASPAPTAVVQTAAAPAPSASPTAFLANTATPALAPTPAAFSRPEKAEMPEGLAVIGEYTTIIINRNDKSRLINLGLACRLLDGLMLEPERVLSFFDVVLNQDAQYQHNLYTKTHDPLPPGLLQVSTTLFDAALMAGLEVVERHPCKLPVTYAHKGLEADVNVDGTVDLVVRNSHRFPVWIKASVDTDNKKFLITMLGQPWQGRRPAKLVSKTTLLAPAPPTVYVEDKTLSKGGTFVSKQPVSGCHVTVSREWQDAATGETWTEALFEVEYEAVAGEVRYPPGEKPKNDPSYITYETEG